MVKITDLPQVVLGTSRSDPVKLTTAVQHALGIGYRIIDTAEMYGNYVALEEAISHALKGS